MNRPGTTARSCSSPRHSGFSLIELLVVVSIIAMMISILLPAMSQSREQGKRTVCLSNLRQIGTSLTMYLGDGNDNLPWTYIHQLNRSTNRLESYPGAYYFSSYSWGGMLAPRPYSYEQYLDTSLAPPEVRWLNRYLDPGASGSGVVKVVQCPGDKSAKSPFVGEDQQPLEEEGPRASWEAYGNSYSINWFFMSEPALAPHFGRRGGNIANLFRFGKIALKDNLAGAAASEWVVMWENQVDQLFVGATMESYGRLGRGWHRRYGFHSFLFLDGHAEHRFYDTRKISGNNWRIWRSWKVMGP